MKKYFLISLFISFLFFYNGNASNDVKDVLSPLPDNFSSYCYNYYRDLCKND